MPLPLNFFGWLTITSLLLSLDVTDTLGEGLSVPRMRRIKILILKITFSNLTMLFVRLLIILEYNFRKYFHHIFAFPVEFWCPHTWIHCVSIVLYSLKWYLKKLPISTFQRQNSVRRVGRIPRVSSVLPCSGFVNTFFKYRVGSGQQLTLQ